MTLRVRRRVLSGLAVLIALTPTTCLRRGPAEPDPTEVTLAAVTGDGQFGPPSQFLIDSLTVAVRTEDGDLPADGILVDWEIASGPGGAQLTPPTSPSDSTGLARVRLRLGSVLGKYVIRASIRDRPEEFVDFEAWAVLPPTLSALSSGIVNAGDIVTLDGTNFSTIAAHNVVLFSGIAGAVIGGSTVRLDVIVPPCLPTRSVDVSVWLGGEASTSLPLSVTGSAGVLDLALGADTTFSVLETPTCLRLGSGSSQEYLAVVQSTATIGAARFDYTFTGLRPPTPLTLRVREGDTVPTGAGSLSAAQAEWDLFLREKEGLLWEQVRLLGGAGFPGAQAARVSPGP
ncbi:MAG: IPT/TIG domain-containing protein, partial [Gemmatimonadetes bacterium]|nr:IPT/TIG domain-containing protein [Gemmatimonadota bacterium]